MPASHMGQTSLCPVWGIRSFPQLFRMYADMFALTPTDLKTPQFKSRPEGYNRPDLAYFFRDFTHFPLANVTMVT
jgi:hypothetical protein